MTMPATPSARTVSTVAWPGCPVCHAAPLAPFAEVEGRRYHRCPHCLATVMDPACRLDAAAEKQLYDLHQNRPDDPGYRRFLSRLAVPLLPHLAPGSRGLDFGCGPGPALAAMLAEQGFAMALYDPFYADDAAVLAVQYDFVTCTEAAEHFFEPRREFARLDRLLRPGGVLGVMTRLLSAEQDFARWQYRRDPSHVVFYQPATLAVLARQFGWRLALPAPDVALFFKPEA